MTARNTTTMNIPASQSTVDVKIIDTTSHVIMPNGFADRTIAGAELLNCPSFSFLIEHTSGRRLLFDLGLRKDHEKLPPVIQEFFKDSNVKLSAPKDVRQLLEENGIDPGSIEAIVWSHWHFDHVGDPSTFPPSTSLIVGPGFSNYFVPGFPENPGAPILVSDYEGRELRELDFSGGDGVIKFGNFDALDYFGDGSFYILDGPGHTVGHLCAAARTTSSPDSFIFMGADACHHSSEMRPSKHLPLPSEILPHPLDAGSPLPCPGSMFEPVLRNGDTALSIYGQKRPGYILCDPDVAEETVEKLQEADANGNIFVVIPHDTHLTGTVDFFPKSANDFLKKGWDVQTKWKFLGDFKQALLG